MTWPKWVILAWSLFALVATITSVGKPRKPLSGSDAAAVLLVTVGLSLLVVIA